MSFKKYIEQIKSQQKVSKPLIKQTRQSAGVTFDSGEAVKITQKISDRYVPPVDFVSASNFAFYGSAKEYYINAIDNIVNYYPYDGTLTEKQLWGFSASFLENWIFENEYPRTNGNVIFSSDGWSTQNADEDGYGEPTTFQYILFDGGLRVGNIVNDEGFTSNLRFGHSAGNCVEFWIKKSEFLPSLTEKEVIIDIWNSGSALTPSNTDNGRFTVQLTASDDVLHVSVASGSVYANSSLTAISSGSLIDNEWHHVALNFSYGASNITVESYLDGNYQGDDTISGEITEVTGAFVATIGSLVTQQTGTTNTTLGWGKLSASLDDFRFWRGNRDGKQIGIFARQPVDGGASTGSTNIDLGVYYKFNEGITEVTATDKTILDYSGRLNNATFVGYTSTARNTGSAFVLSGLAIKETKDPILYLSHPSLSSYRAGKIITGSVYDEENISSFYNTLPEWITSEDQQNSGELKKLTQIMASALDELYLEIKTFPLIKAMEYYNDKVSRSKFAQKALNSSGFVIGRILEDESALVSMFNTGDKGEFLQKLEDVKRVIYSNLYNNSVEIFKTKGTPESLRNALRCFGVDNELINLSVYEDNSIIQLGDKRELYSEKYKFINFATASNNVAVVYTSTSGTVGVPFISGTSGTALPIEARLANTYECQAFLPKYPRYGDATNVTFAGLTSSIFGVHGVTASSHTDTSTTFSGDDAGFEVYAVRDSLTSRRVKFVLTSSVVAGDSQTFPELTTELFSDSYDNETWTVAVTIKPIAYGMGDLNNALQRDSGSYIVNFRGYNVEDDTVYNSFNLTASMHSDRAIKLLSQNRKPYYGAARTNFTGSMLMPSDLNIGFFRVWLDNLTDDELISHAKDPRNKGRAEPYNNFLPLSSEFSGTYVPSINSLIMDVGTDNIASSDDSGQFYLPDLSSGSYKETPIPYLNTVLGSLYQSEGYGFTESSTNVYTSRFFTVGKTINPENFGELDGVRILNEDDIATKSLIKAKIAYFTIEKSAQQAINRDIISFFSSLTGFNELIGAPINKYRMEYKDLKKLATEYFSTVISKRTSAAFFEYYKWLDNAINDMLINLLPASLNGSDKIYNVIESHILERNKFQYQLPTIEFRTPDLEAVASGSNNVKWKFAHYPLTDIEKDNCYWWRYKAERDNATFNSNLPEHVVIGREQILSVTKQAQDRKVESALKESVIISKEIHGGINFGANKKLDYYKGVIYGKWNSAGYFNFINIPASTVSSAMPPLKSCDDDLELLTNRKLTGKAEANREETQGSKLQLLAPFNVFSASVGTGSYVDTAYDARNPNEIVTNLHHDVFGPTSNQPLQGTFTSQRVGGSKSRKIRLTDNLTNETNRPERFQVDMDYPTDIFIQSTRYDGGYAAPIDQFYQDPPVRAPVNIKNIKTSGSALGNFSKNYEVVQTSGRSINNLALRELTGIAGNLESPYISGGFDFPRITGTANQTVFVERFSAPGGPDTNGPFLDPVGREYSVYNDLNLRNSVVRGAWNSLLKYSSVFGGYQTASNDLSASIHKVQRNTTKIMENSGGFVVTGVLADNGFFTRPIPARDFGYSWILSSAPASGNFVIEAGHVLTSSTAITFYTSSIRTFGSPTSSIGYDEINYAGYVTPGRLANRLPYHFNIDETVFPPVNLIAPTILNQKGVKASGSVIFHALDPSEYIQIAHPIVRFLPSPDSLFVAPFELAFDSTVVPGSSTSAIIGVDGLATGPAVPAAVANAFSQSLISAIAQFADVHFLSSSVTVTDSTCSFSLTLDGAQGNQVNRAWWDQIIQIEGNGFPNPAAVTGTFMVGGLGTGEDFKNIYFLNVINNGNSGWGTYRQLQGSYNPLARNLRKQNIIVSERPPLDKSEPAAGAFDVAGEVVPLAAYEPAVVSDKPVLLIADLEGDGKGTIFSLPYNSQKRYFFDSELEQDLVIGKNKNRISTLERFYDFYKSDSQNVLKEEDVSYAKYAHQIYPLQKYSYLGDSLLRKSFTQTWTDSQYNRSVRKAFNQLALDGIVAANATQSFVNPMGFNLLYQGPDATGSWLGSPVGQQFSDSFVNAVGPSISVLDTFTDLGPPFATFALDGGKYYIPSASFPLHFLTQSIGGTKTYLDLRNYFYGNSTDKYPNLYYLPGVGDYYQAVEGVAYNKAVYDRRAAQYMTFGILRDPKNVINQFIITVPSAAYGTVAGQAAMDLGDNGIAGVPDHVYGPLLEMPFINAVPDNPQRGPEIAERFFAPWSAPGSSSLGRGPSYYNKHSNYSEYIKLLGKDYSLIPEYIVSNHISALVAGDDLDGKSVSSYSITGSSVVDMSDTVVQMNTVARYMEGDSLLNFKEFGGLFDASPVGTYDIPKIRIRFDAIKKLLPYEGFYPAERTVQLAQLFSSSLAPAARLIGGGATFRTLMQPYFMPGILYNSVKAGLAMSYGYFNSPYNLDLAYSWDSGLGKANREVAIGDATASFVPLPFEEIVTLSELTNQKTFYDMYPHQSMSRASTASLQEIIEPLYQMAMSNFMASTIDFCLENNSLTTVVSQPEKDLALIPNLDDVYGMEISVMGVTGSSADQGPWDLNAVYANGWGPSVSGSGRTGQNTDIATDRVWQPQWGFGSASILLEWRPTKLGKYTIAEIQQELTATFGASTLGVGFSPFVTSSVPSLSESINYLGRLQGVIATIDPATKEVASVKTPEDPASAGLTYWAFQPKWETPYLTRNSNVNGTGIWKSFCELPNITNKAASRLVFKDYVPPGALDNLSLKTYLSLPDEATLGTPSNSSFIKEAIVCIPYMDMPNSNPVFHTVSKYVKDAYVIEAKKTGKSNEWSRLDKILDEYVFPPAWDWKRNPKLQSQPMGMVVQEYDLELKKEDMALFWQNLPIPAMGTFEKETDYIDIEFDKSIMFDESLLRYLKWVVFKVKKRAQTNYFQMTIDNPQYTDFSFDDLPSVQNSKFKTVGGWSVNDYSYNYPYDFCSLIETAKVSVEVDFIKTNKPAP